MWADSRKGSSSMNSLNERYSFKSLLPQVVDNNSALIAELKRCPLKQNIWMQGEPGGGKTHLARACANRYLYRGMKAELVRSPEFRSMSIMLPEDRNDALYRFSLPDLLIIDDIDKCTWTPKALECLWEVMSLRHQCPNKRTIVTSNISPNAMLDYWSAMKDVAPSTATATLDRFQPCAGFVVKSAGSLRRIV